MVIGVELRHERVFITCRREVGVPMSEDSIRKNRH